VDGRPVGLPRPEVNAALRSVKVRAAPADMEGGDKQSEKP